MAYGRVYMMYRRVDKTVEYRRVYMDPSPCFDNHRRVYIHIDVSICDIDASIWHIDVSICKAILE